jgi:hypothetical protein
MPCRATGSGFFQTPREAREKHPEALNRVWRIVKTIPQIVFLSCLIQPQFPVLACKRCFLAFAELVWPGRSLYARSGIWRIHRQRLFGEQTSLPAIAISAAASTEYASQRSQASGALCAERRVI